MTLPSDPGTPFADFAAVQTQLSTTCAGIRTLTAEIGLSGRAGEEKIGGRVVAGFEQPSSMRLEGVGPFGRVFFYLVARGGAGTLLLTQSSQIIRNAAPEAILEAMTGVAMGPAELQAVLTGCVLPAPRAISGMVHANGMASIEIEGEPQQGTAPSRATLYLQRAGAEWQLRAATRDRWRLEYTPGSGQLPQKVRIVSTRPDLRVDITADVKPMEINQGLSPEAFTLNEPKDVTTFSIEDLRRAGPLRGQ